MQYSEVKKTNKSEVLTGWNGTFYSHSSCVEWYEFIAIDFSLGLELSAKNPQREKVWLNMWSIQLNCGVN